MTPGARVQHRPTGLTGVVVASRGHEIEVELPSGERQTWTTRTVVVLSRAVAPRGVVRASERDREVARLHVDGGLSRPRVAERLGLTVSQVESALRRVRDAREDEANRRIGP